MLVRKSSPWIVATTLFCSLALLAATPAHSQSKPPKTVVVVSWDGAADWIIDRLLSEGKLPNVARLVKAGIRAEYSTPAYPSKTACGHAALWTGAYGDVNGITGNAVPLLPKSEHTLMESRSGFLATSLQAEPLFVTAARQGKKVLILSATQSFPPDPYLKTLRMRNVPASHFVTFDGFESPIAGDKIWEGKEWRETPADAGFPDHTGSVKSFVFKIGDSDFAAFTFDDPKDPVAGFDSVLIREGATATVIKPSPAADNTKGMSSRFPVTVHDPQRGDLFGYGYFRLFALDPTSGQMTLYQRQVNGIRGTASLEERKAYLEAYGGFHGSPFRPYQQGQLGKTLWEGGEGEAEKRLIETIRHDCELLKNSVRFGLNHYRPDLMFHYTPVIDSAGHTWMGAIDPDSPTYNPTLAAKLLPFYEQVYQLCDDWLGTIIDLVGNDGAVCLVSDHGMAGVGRSFAPNSALRDAGLLAMTTDGKRIDLAQTRICAPSWGDYLLTVNSVDWKDGIVTAEERETVLRKATDALLSVRDPQTGRPVVTRVFRPDEVIGLGMGGISGGDLYFDVAPGYVPTNGQQDTVVAVDDSPIGSGVHGFFPLRRKMQAVFFLGGRGLVAGREIAGVRQIDVAPTLAALLGIAAPANAKGHILGECFSQGQPIGVQSVKALNHERRNNALH